MIKINGHGTNENDQLIELLQLWHPDKDVDFTDDTVLTKEQVNMRTSAKIIKAAGGIGANVDLRAKADAGDDSDDVLAFVEARLDALAEGRALKIKHALKTYTADDWASVPVPRLKLVCKVLSIKVTTGDTKATAIQKIMDKQQEILDALEEAQAEE